MKIRIFIFSFMCILFFCCQKAPDEKSHMPDSIEKLSIIEFNGWSPDYEIINDSIIYDPYYDKVIGVTEIDKNFDIKVIRKHVLESTSYLYGETLASDSLRNTIIETINNFRSDSIDTREKPRIYDGHYCFILIEKKGGNTIVLGGYPDCISKETDNLSRYYMDSTEVYLTKKIGNQDSIRNYLKRYDKFYPERLSPPPPPLLKNKIKFKAPPYFR